MRKPKEGHKHKKRFLSRAIRQGIHIAVSGLLGATIVLLLVVALVIDRRPDLQPWHKVRLSSEYEASSNVKDFAGYLALEEELFAELDEFKNTLKLSDRADKFNRFRTGSPSNPNRWQTNWNRTFELTPSEPTVAVLLIHGMSDSPYSMRSLGERLHTEGAHVIGLRVPGHGTAPSSLTRTRWQDMAGAVRLAVKHLRDEMGDKPVYIVGFSNGGALAVHHALTSIEDDSLAKVDGLVLLSPEIGISKLAALAAWQERFGHLLGMRKFAWTSVRPPFDPFKYRSFPLNAGKQAHLITNQIQSQINKLQKSGDLARFPPVLAFQSALDSTVSAPDLVHKFFFKLPKGDHELVVFDVNRSTAIEFLKHDPRDVLDELLNGQDLLFTVTMVTNEKTGNASVSTLSHAPGEAAPTETPTNMEWPADLYSLSHVALPFPPDDPIYGGLDPKESPGIHLGDLAPRGERGALVVAPSELLRLHWNPFYEYVETRTLEFVNSAGVVGETAENAGG